MPTRDTLSCGTRGGPEDHQREWRHEGQEIKPFRGETAPRWGLDLIHRGVRWAKYHRTGYCCGREMKRREGMASRGYVPDRRGGVRGDEATGEDPSSRWRLEMRCRTSGSMLLSSSSAVMVGVTAIDAIERRGGGKTAHGTSDYINHDLHRYQPQDKGGRTPVRTSEAKTRRECKG
jgi:hypothetical protein